MLGRLAVALPLVLLALAAGFVALKRGWLRLPSAVAVEGSRLRQVASLGLAPGVRLVLVEFDERRVLLAMSRSGVAVLDGAERAS